MNKIVFISILAILFLVFSSLTLKHYTTSVHGKIVRNEQIQSTNGSIIKYNYFFNLCNSIKFYETYLDAQYEALESATNYYDIQRILININGLNVIRFRLIDQYNVNAQKYYTITQLRDNNLPYQLDDIRHERGYRTQC